MVAAVLFLLVTLVAEPPSTPAPLTGAEPAGPQLPVATYETRQLQGQPFKVGFTPRHEVWLALLGGRGLDFKGGTEPRLVLIVANSSGEAVPFDPASVRVWERSSRGDKPLRTLSAEKVEKRLRSRNLMIASLQGRSMSGRASEPPTSPVIGSTSPTEGPSFVVRIPPGNSMEGPGSNAPMPSYVDPRTGGADPLAPGRTEPPTSLFAIFSTLMRPWTLAPGTYYGGLVYLDKPPSHALRVEVTVGDDSFEVELPIEK